MPTPNSIESIKANIAARKAREAQEAKERAENNGLTIAEIEAYQKSEQLRLLRIADEARTDRQFTSALRNLMFVLENLPGSPNSPEAKEKARQEREEAKRLYDLQLKAEQRAIDQFGKF